VWQKSIVRFGVFGAELRVCGYSLREGEKGGVIIRDCAGVGTNNYRLPLAYHLIAMYLHPVRLLYVEYSLDVEYAMLRRLSVRVL
jgi:hypothetical protein